MKDLREYINEQRTDESLSAAVIGLSIAKLIGLMAIAETMFGNTENSYSISSLNPLEQIKHHGGIVLGIVNWIETLGERISDRIIDNKFRKNVDKLKNSDEFKAYLELPKKKQTLKELERIAKETCNIKDIRAARNVWDEIKKGAPKDVQKVEIVEEEK